MRHGRRFSAEVRGSQVCDHDESCSVVDKSFLAQTTAIRLQAGKPHNCCIRLVNNQRNLHLILVLLSAH
jgi:hypothetical protein